MDELLTAFKAALGEAVRSAVGVDAQDGMITALAEAVQQLATVYADQPGYRAKWRP